VIRTASHRDEPALRALDLETWSSLSSPVPAPPPEREFDIADVLVSEFDGAIAGYVKLGPVLPIAATDHVLEVKGLAVSPAHRRRGVGRALMDAAIHEAKARGARRLTLRVLGPNVDARALYAACGFEVEGVVRELFFLDGRYVDDVLMAVPLTAGGSPAST
jgi:ribosomal protein S18 acetylase RimI-like enzyme